jgi:hypothetical protein
VSATVTRPALESGHTSPLSASDAAQLAAWYAHYALDRLNDDPRRFHPGVRSHLTAACVQHEAAARVLAPEHDQAVRDS